MNCTLAVRSLSLLRVGTSGGAAISASWPEPPSHIAFGAVTTTIEDVHIASDPWPTAGGNYWAWGIRLAHVTCAKINTFSILGPGPGGGYAAISIGGTFNGDQTNPDPHSSIAVYLRNGDIASYVRGIEIKDASEGVHINQVSIHDTWWALQLTGPAPGTAITNNQLSAQIAGIETSSLTDLAITDNRIVQEPGQNFIGVHMTVAYNIRLIGNTIVSTSPASSNGVIFDTIGENGTIEGNTIQGVTNGIWLRGTFNGWLVRGNILRVTATPVVNGGANFIVNNF
jgi:parallel beta-helix repeat protein